MSGAEPGPTTMPMIMSNDIDAFIDAARNQPLELTPALATAL